LVIKKWNGNKDFEKWQWRLKDVLMRNEVQPVLYAFEELTDEILTAERKKMKKWMFTL